MKFSIILAINLLSLTPLRGMTYVQAKVATALTSLTLLGATGYCLEDDIKYQIKYNSYDFNAVYKIATTLNVAGNIGAYYFFHRHTSKGCLKRGLNIVNGLDNYLLKNLVSIHSSHSNKSEALYSYCQSYYKLYDLPLARAFNAMKENDSAMRKAHALLDKSTKIPDASPEIIQKAQEVIQQLDVSQSALEWAEIEIKKPKEFIKQVKIQQLKELTKATDRNASANEWNAVGNTVNGFSNAIKPR